MRQINILFIMIVILCSIGSATLVFAQLPDVDLSISPEMDTKNMLTHEDAVILSSLLEVKLKKNWKTEYNFSRKMKLLSEKACQLYGDIHVPYLKKSQTVSELKGYTLTPSGKKIKAKKISDYMPGKELPLYDDQALKVLSMAGLSKGCEIEYSYKIKSDDLGMSGLFSDFFMLTQTVPINEIEMSIKVPKDVKLYYLTNKIEKNPTIKKDGMSKKYTWNASNIEPLHIEESMPPIKSITAWIAVSTLDSWDDYIRGWRKIYNLRSAVNPKIKKLTNELIAGANTDTEKAERIFNYVQNKIRYLGLEFGRAGWVPYSATRVFKDKSGDCKGKTVLYIAMLKVGDIEAYPAMLSSRVSGPVIKEFCNDTQFSHVIPVCEIDGDLVWADPTSRVTFGNLPGLLQGVEALVIKKDGGGFYKTLTTEASDNKMEMCAKITCNPDGSAEGSLKIEGYGNNAIMYKTAMENLNKELQEHFIQTLANQWVPRATIREYNYSDYLDASEKIQLGFNFYASDYAQRSKDLLIIDPLFGKDPRVEFVKQERFYDIDLDVKECSFRKEEIVVPDGFKFDMVPKDYKKENPYFKAEIKYRTDGNILIKEAYFEWLRTSIPKSAYQEFKNHLDEFDSLMNKKIILREI